MEIVDIDGLQDCSFFCPKITGWTFYYDESNNPRKFKIDPTKDYLVNDVNSLFYDFVIGGILVPPDKPIDIDKLKTKLGLDEVNELKSKNILKRNGGIESFKNERVRTFLRWVLDQNYIIHFFSSNNLYDCIIELVDDPLYNTEYGHYIMHFHSHMKKQLY